MNESTHCATRASNHERSLGAVVNELKEDAKSFIDTRIRMVKAEVQESLGAAKIGVPLAAIALGLFAIAGLLFTAAAVVLVAYAFAGNPYAWFFAFIIIGFLWAIFGAVAGFFAASQFKGRFPKRTIEVLKADKVWLQTEARSHS